MSFRIVLLKKQWTTPTKHKPIVKWIPVLKERLQQSETSVDVRQLMYIHAGMDICIETIHRSSSPAWSSTGWMLRPPFPGKSVAPIIVSLQPTNQTPCPGKKWCPRKGTAFLQTMKSCMENRFAELRTISQLLVEEGEDEEGKTSKSSRPKSFRVGGSRGRGGSTSRSPVVLYRIINNLRDLPKCYDGGV